MKLKGSDPLERKARFIGAGSMPMDELLANSNVGRCFVGSLNLDPRAIDINTENGVVIESGEVCDELQGRIIELMRPENAWKVTLDDQGNLEWTSDEGTVDQQPARSTGQRISGALFQMLPLQNQL